MSRPNHIGLDCMSYQDAKWNYNNDAPPTANPCPLSEVNSYLAKIGYQMMGRDQYAPDWYPVQWVKEGCDPISLPPPHYSAEGFYDTLVYDRNVIADFLKGLGITMLQSNKGHRVSATKKVGT